MHIPPCPTGPCAGTCRRPSPLGAAPAPPRISAVLPRAPRRPPGCGSTGLLQLPPQARRGALSDGHLSDGHRLPARPRGPLGERETQRENRQSARTQRRLRPAYERLWIPGRARFSLTPRALQRVLPTPHRVSCVLPCLSLPLIPTFGGSAKMSLPKVVFPTPPPLDAASSQTSSTLPSSLCFLS